MEFHLAFWESLGQELVDRKKRDDYSYSKEDDKDKTLLDNWRLISLLNFDYKVASRAITSSL